eukprot:1157552-Pelagomonas_calceolata.AAC.2
MSGNLIAPFAKKCMDKMHLPWSSNDSVQGDDSANPALTALNCMIEQKAPEGRQQLGMHSFFKPSAPSITED